MARLPSITRETVPGYVATYAGSIVALFAFAAWAVIGHEQVVFFATFAFMIVAVVIVTMVENASKRLLCDGELAKTRGPEIAAAAKTARTVTVVSTVAPLIGYGLYQLAGRSYALLAVLLACALFWMVLSIASPAHVVRKFG